MTRSSFMAARGVAIKFGADFDWVKCSPREHRELLEEVRQYMTLELQGVNTIYGYRLEMDENMADGFVVFHSPDKPRTLIVPLT